MTRSRYHAGLAGLLMAAFAVVLAGYPQLASALAPLTGRWATGWTGTPQIVALAHSQFPCNHCMRASIYE